ncbi:hypothetical protein LWM68_25390 [Niabella sp. W65]|nr:hypothetical protein [Niabella sp. W65]MCH7365803.1 hypothetical protein [Niabella sp. W65]ULT41558.1 hypothetical protein KRR40_44305 [Niabella sp. I65]
MFPTCLIGKRWGQHTKTYTPPYEYTWTVAKHKWNLWNITSKDYVTVDAGGSGKYQSILHTGSYLGGSVLIGSYTELYTSGYGNVNDTARTVTVNGQFGITVAGNFFGTGINGSCRYR